MLTMIFFRRSWLFALTRKYKQAQHSKESVAAISISKSTISNQNCADEAQVFKIDDVSDQGNVDIVLSGLNAFFTKLFINSYIFETRNLIGLV